MAIPRWSDFSDLAARLAGTRHLGLDGDGIPAAVLVGLLDGDAPGVLLTLRAAGLPSHPGQVSFPGGKIDPGDPSPEGAALREAREEIGLDPARVRLIGRLPGLATVTGYHITPVVGFVDPEAPLRADAREVADIFTLPLAVLLDPAAPGERSDEWRGRTRTYWVWPHDRHHIWGATASILVELAAVLRA